MIPFRNTHSVGFFSLLFIALIMIVSSAVAHSCNDARDFSGSPVPEQLDAPPEASLAADHVERSRW